jgi:hypothetical protein
MFISHRPEDKAAAEEIRDSLINWGIEKADISLSHQFFSDGNSNDTLTHPQQAVLAKTELFIILYTGRGEGWTNCLIEFTVAVLNSDSATNVVLFEWSDNRPKQFNEALRYKFSSRDLQWFADWFHRENDFFPGCSAFAPEISDDEVRNRGTELFDALKPWMEIEGSDHEGETQPYEAIPFDKGKIGDPNRSARLREGLSHRIRAALADQSPDLDVGQMEKESSLVESFASSPEVDLIAEQVFAPEILNGDHVVAESSSEDLDDSFFKNDGDPHTIFISHKHHRQLDEQIALAFHEEFVNWGISPKSIFFSSGFDVVPNMGEDLTPQIKLALAGTNLFLMIFTDPNDDWSYTCYECGVATDARGETTRKVLFTTTGDRPGFFGDTVSFGFDEKQIARFTDQFHTNENFFPGQPAWGGDDVPPAQLDSRSESLSKRLNAAVRTATPKRTFKYPCMMLSLDSTNKEEVRQLWSQEDLKGARAIIRDQLKFSPKRTSVAEFFGLADSTDPRPWLDVLKEWRSRNKLKDSAGKAKKNGKYSENWISQLHSQILDAIVDRSSKEKVIYFPSFEDAKVNWYQMILTRYQEYYRGDMEFDVFFLSAPAPKTTKKRPPGLVKKKVAKSKK